jgi:hypothetical protein
VQNLTPVPSSDAIEPEEEDAIPHKVSSSQLKDIYCSVQCRYTDCCVLIEIRSVIDPDEKGVYLFLAPVHEMHVFTRY